MDLGNACLYRVLVEPLHKRMSSDIVWHKALSLVVVIEKSALLTYGVHRSGHTGEFAHVVAELVLFLH